MLAATPPSGWRRISEKRKPRKRGGGPRERKPMADVSLPVTGFPVIGGKKREEGKEEREKKRGGRLPLPRHNVTRAAATSRIERRKKKRWGGRGGKREEDSRIPSFCKLFHPLLTGYSPALKGEEGRGAARGGKLDLPSAWLRVRSTYKPYLRERVTQRRRDKRKKKRRPLAIGI